MVDITSEHVAYVRALLIMRRAYNDELFSNCLDALRKAREKWTEDNGSKFETYVYKCVCNEIIKSKRQIRRETYVPPEWLDSLESPSDLSSYSADEAQALLQILPPDCQEVAQLLWCEGLQPQQIANLLRLKLKRIIYIRDKSLGILRRYCNVE